jgi:hypothetical protein
MASAQSYRSATVAEKGQLHMVPDSGRELMPPLLPDQVSFADASISPPQKPWWAGDLSLRSPWGTCHIPGRQYHPSVFD